MEKYSAGVSFYKKNGFLRNCTLSFYTKRSYQLFLWIEKDQFWFRHFWTTLTKGLIVVDKFDEAIEFFVWMVEKGYPSDVVAYNTIINGLSKEERPSFLLNCLGTWRMEYVGQT